ncbi:MAG: acyl-CoA dehydrogenase family protein [Novosphingobium sp.]
MDFGLTDDQQLLTTSFEALLQQHREAPQGVHGFVAFSETLQAELAASGYFEVAAQEGFGPLEAALLAEEAATCPVSAEVAQSALIGPLLGDAALPVAVAWGLGQPVRFLPQAGTVCLFESDGVTVGVPGEWDAADSVAAYPLGILRSMGDGPHRFTGERAADIRRRALVAIAAEAAGLMRGALDLTVAYVKERQQFGQPLGNFQAIQHRLAECAQVTRAARNLAFKAAFLDEDRAAATACLYAQEAARQVIYDCHQFHGAMGLTLEYPLHLWTYRLKLLQGEAGGKQAQAASLAEHIWPERG